MVNLTRYSVDPTSECWLWQGALNNRGYAVVGDGEGSSMLAHRAAWQEKHGAIADGAQIDHVCHNADQDCPGGTTCKHRRCINPAHLEAVTASQNMRRAIRSRRPRTHCTQGHEMTEENTIIYERKHGRIERICRECKLARQRDEYRKRLERNGTPRRRHSRYDVA